jgi:lipoprotein-releasing system ATP-binding protein
MTVLEAGDLTKVYTSGDAGGDPITVLDGVTLQVGRGEMVAIVGASGAGKSTLLHLLGALDQPTRGWVRIGGERLDARTDDELSAMRNRQVGFVFQFHHLLREFSARENVMMPLRIAGWDEARAKARASELLERVGLAARMEHRPAALSGGEQQRTAVARALATDPVILLADEPSGNLDHQNSERLHDLFVALSRDLEIAMVIATHNKSLAARADRVLLLEDGRLADTDVREGVL